VGPLQGLKVVEIGQIISAPYAAVVFADLGAEVIKVERPGGDDARRMGQPFRHGDSMSFYSYNHGKRSVTLDLRGAQDRASLDELLADADIFVHNLRPGVAESLGIGADGLCARFPRLVYCEITAFGPGGPRSHLPGYEPLIQAYSGLSSLNGGPEDPPKRIGVSLCDIGSGMWAVIGCLSAIERRHHTGRGGVVRCSLLETALGYASTKVDTWVNQEMIEARHASGHPHLVPYQAFDTSDSPVIVCCGSDALFAKLAVVLGRRDWITDERFAANRARLEHRDEIVGQIQELLLIRGRDEWLATFEAAGVPSGPLQSLPEAVADPQVEALGLLQAVPGGDYRLTGLPVTIDGGRPPIRGPAPNLERGLRR
jgi:formyl-CoA transferase